MPVAEIQTSNRKHPPPKATDETLKETFESIVIAFILAFIFRAYVVEAFIIPTGSMAPTLLGQHFDVDCTQCGYRFTVDHADQTPTADRQNVVACPMCQWPETVLPATATRSGDRLLVQKYLYNFAGPRRWDVVVFRNPQAFNGDGSPGPEINYIKRLVGLPNESLLLIDGNVHVQPHDPPDAEWRIARKTDPEANPHWEKIQRAVWQPIYHSQYVPLDHGRVGTTGGDRPGPRRRDPWVVPWTPAAGQGENWDRGSRARGWARSYTFTPSPEQSVGELTFDWTGYHLFGTPYAYNSLVNRSTLGFARGQPIEEIRLAATVRPKGEKVRVQLETVARLEHEPERLVVEFCSSGRVRVTARPWRDGDGQKPVSAERIIAEAELPPYFAVGRATPVELWWVDQELLVWIDGEVALRRAFDLPLYTLRERPPPLDRPDLNIRVADGPATLHGVELDRDLAYTDRLGGDGTPANRGVLARAPNGRLLDGQPITIRAGRFFVLGDNSPISSDGRFWGDVEPWIERRMFTLPDERRAAAGDLQYGPDVDYAHVVPRGLLIGRAFFIYFPAPYAVNRTGRQIVPNFGQMRFVH
jgi:signal peptidase I